MASLIRRCGPLFPRLRTFARLSAGVVVSAALVACSGAADVADPTFVTTRPGVMRVATALPAPGFWDGPEPSTTDATDVDGGFERALAGLLAERFDLELDVVDVDFADLVNGDLSGADLAVAQLAITDERAGRMDFSIGYYDADIGVLMPTGGSVPDLRAARALRWVVVGGSIEEDFLDDIVVPDAAPLVVADETEAAAALRDGRGDAALADLPTALVIAGTLDELDVVARFATRQQYGVALPLGGARTNLDAINTALRALKADGTLDDLADEWLEPRFERSPDSVPVIIARTPRSTP